MNSLAQHVPLHVTLHFYHETSTLSGVRRRPIIENFTENRMTLTAAMFEALGLKFGGPRCSSQIANFRGIALHLHLWPGDLPVPLPPNAVAPQVHA